MRLVSVIIVLLIFPAAVFAQDDSIQYRFGLPLPGEDSIVDSSEPDRPPYRRIEALRYEELPEDLVRALDKQAIYEGWRDTLIYFDPASKLYIVPVPYANGIRIFRMNARGKPVAFDDVDSSGQR